MKPIKFFTDENIGFGVITPLRESGFVITSVLEGNRGINDTKVLSLANKENRIIITTDKDFGELIYSEKLIHAGVILLRLKKDSSKNKLKYLNYLFINYLDELHEEFIVIKDNTIRIGGRHIAVLF